MTAAGGAGGRRRRFRRWFADQPITAKLSIAFGSLVGVTLVVITVGLLASSVATSQIDRTDAVRAPIALASASAESNLLRMLSEMRAYLALGDPALRASYDAAKVAFESDLEDLVGTAKRAADGADIADARALLASLDEVQVTYERLSGEPERLFAIRDDQLKREPALQILLGPVQDQVGRILVATNDLLDVQGARPPTAASASLLTDLAAFQSSFLGEVAGLRGYVTTKRTSFKFEYTSNVTINDSAFSRLQTRRAALLPSQQADIDAIAAARAAYEPLAPQMFRIVEGDHAREDLYLFRAVVTPITDHLLAVLSATTTAEEAFLRSELTAGRASLGDARIQTAGLGAAALLVGILLAIGFRRVIVGPVRRLTAVAATITDGDLGARATVDQADEIGQLATAFNTMTGRLADTVGQLRETNATQAEYIQEVGHLTDAAAAVEADAFQPTALSRVEARDDALGQLARTFVRMAREVRAREERLRNQVRELRIEIDEARQAKKVAEITGTDYFKGLRDRAADLRRTMTGDEGDGGPRGSGDGAG